eukprot:355087-Chlamydomonas_euryale.AAC.1
MFPGWGSPWKRPNSSSCRRPDTTPHLMNADRSSCGLKHDVERGRGGRSQADRGGGGKGAPGGRGGGARQMGGSCQTEGGRSKADGAGARRTGRSSQADGGKKRGGRHQPTLTASAPPH